MKTGMLHELGPGLLLAAPRLADPNFTHTVVLLGRHEDEGSLGWVLNGESLGIVRELLQNAELVPAGHRLPERASFDCIARRGGPVQPESGWMLYSRANNPSLEPLPGEIAIGADLAITGDVGSFAELIDGGGPSVFRILLGYAGWAPGQLQAEVIAGAWLPAPLDADLVLSLDDNDDESDLWTRAYQRATGANPAAFSSHSRGSA